MEKVVARCRETDERRVVNWPRRERGPFNAIPRDEQVVRGRQRLACENHLPVEQKAAP